MHEEGAIDGQLLEGEACILLGKMLIHSSLPATGIFFFFLQQEFLTAYYVPRTDA